ncbi:hypothetical protein ACET3Z_011290 [Daucus carota]
MEHLTQAILLNPASASLVYNARPSQFRVTSISGPCFAHGIQRIPEQFVAAVKAKIPVNIVLQFTNGRKYITKVHRR